jgi:hypothetical protein
MRSSTFNDYTIEFPDEIAFCFNPILIRVKPNGSAALTTLAVEIGCGDESVTYEVAAFDNVAIADVRQFAQGMFTRDELTQLGYAEKSLSSTFKTMGFSITLNGSGDTFAFSCGVHWGALKYGGDTFNDYKTIKWWPAFPFTFPLEWAEGDEVVFSKNGVPNRYMSLGEGEEDGLYNLTTELMSADAEYYDILDYNGTIKQATFDTSFDLTFYMSGGTGSKLLRINVGHEDEGVYLRWVDRHGLWRHWLFKKGEESRKTAVDGQFVRNNLVDVGMEYGRLKGNGRQQAYTRNDTWPICAPLVDEDTWDMLFDLTTSPIVDMFSGYAADGTTPKWVSVCVAAGTFTRAKDKLQDFVCNISLPETPIQTL